jgi:hypothetical protein
VKLKELEAAETARLHLRDIKGEPLFVEVEGGEKKPVVATLYGPGTPQGDRLLSDTQRNMLRDMGAKVLAEDDKEVHAELLASATLSIEGLEIPEGVTPKDFYTAMYANPRFGYLTRQIEQFQMNWGNFPPASSKS